MIKAHDGHYADALSKGYGLTILVAETTGAITPSFAALLRRYARLASEPGVSDYTAYGESRSSPRDFYSHHLAAHSAAIVLADVDTTVLPPPLRERTIKRSCQVLACNHLRDGPSLSKCF